MKNTYYLVRTEESFAHWGWWVLSLLLFWPIIIVLALCPAKSYRVVINDGATQSMTALEFSMLKKTHTEVV